MQLSKKRIFARQRTTALPVDATDSGGGRGLVARRIEADAQQQSSVNIRTALRAAAADKTVVKVGPNRCGDAVDDACVPQIALLTTMAKMLPVAQSTSERTSRTITAASHLVTLVGT